MHLWTSKWSAGGTSHGLRIICLSLASWK